MVHASSNNHPTILIPNQCINLYDINHYFPINDMKGFGGFLEWHDVTTTDILCGRDKLTFNHTGKYHSSKLLYQAM